MPWCPICKNEYVDGVTECSDCKVALVDSLEEAMPPVITGKQDEMERLLAFLEYSKFKNLILNHNEETDVFELFCDEKDEKKVRRASTIFYQQEALHKSMLKKKSGEDSEVLAEEKDLDDYFDGTKDENESKIDDELSEDTESDVKSDERSSSKSTSTKPYRKKSEKAADFKSSGYTLIPVGIIGILVLLGIEFRIIPIQLVAPGKYLTYTVMGGLFLIFIIVGIYSMRASKKYEQDAEEEDKFIVQLKQWVEEHIDAEDILRVIFKNEPDSQEEVIYFKVVEIVRDMIKEEFENLDEAFLDDFIDNIYHDQFEQHISEHFQKL